MSAIEVQRLQSLKGEIKIQGSKNAVLPMMAAAVLHKGTTVIHNVPRIQDVFCMLGILERIGCKCSLEGHTLTIGAEEITRTEIPEEYIKSMRSSILLSGPLLGRMKRAVTSFPGGCSIGERRIDFHLEAFQKLGAVVEEQGEMLSVVATKLAGASIDFPLPSVGATENAILAAVLAEGTTVIRQAAREPEIVMLCEFLNNMGAKIKRVGSLEIVVTGVKELKDCQFTVAGDRIVAGTYLTAVMAAGGEAVLEGICPEELIAPSLTARKMGAKLEPFKDGLKVLMEKRPLAVSLTTGPYPDFPTDLQSQTMAVMAGAKGLSRMKETIFEDRFGAARELSKLGADIVIEGKQAVIRGRRPLKGAVVTAGDLRGGAALVVAGLSCEGITRIEDCFHIERGYEDICGDLKSLGAGIRGIE